jgi:hypothetical protein
VVVLPTTVPVEDCRVTEVHPPPTVSCFCAVYVTGLINPAGVVKDTFAFKPVTGTARGAVVSKFA